MHRREQLLTWLLANVTDGNLVNVLSTGSLELIGHFNPLPTSKNPGWIVRATSKHNTKYLFAIAEDQATLQFYWFIVPSISWDTWTGYTSPDPLKCGDRPELNRLKKEIHGDGTTPRFHRIKACTEVHKEIDGS